MERTKVLAAVIAAVPPVLAGLLAAAYPGLALYLAVAVVGIWLAAVFLWQYYRGVELQSKLKESESDRERLRATAGALEAEKARLLGQVDTLQRALTEARSAGSWAYFPVETRTKVLSRNDNVMTVKKWWPAGQKVRVNFKVTDTTDIEVRCYETASEVQAEPLPQTMGTQVWIALSVKGWSKEFDTKAGVWFFVAGRPPTNVLDPTVTISVEELRRTG